MTCQNREASIKCCHDSPKIDLIILPNGEQECPVPRSSLLGYCMSPITIFKATQFRILVCSVSEETEKELGMPGSKCISKIIVQFCPLFVTDDGVKLVLSWPPG